MKCKKVIIFTIIVLIILSLFVPTVYANDYSGSFLKGFSDGFNKSLQIGKQIKQKKEAKWKTEQLEELEKVFVQWNIFADTIQNLVESGQMTPELGKKFLVLNSLLPMDLQEHGQNFYNGIMSVDKSKVAEEKQYFENVIDTISLTSGQINSETFGKLSNLLSNNKKAVINNIIQSGFSHTTPQSELKYNSFENKWEFASSKDQTKYNPFENKWSYESNESSFKYNAFENKWEYAKPGSTLKYNPFSNSWSYE